MLTHCKRGHPYDEANTYVSRIGKQCRACRKIARAKRTFAERAAEPESTLTPAQVRRLKDAFADGVTIVDLAERFGLHHDAVVSLARGEA